MKKYLLYGLLFTALFGSCKKGIDPAPGERPEERTAAAMKSYSDALTGNTTGWKAFLYPSGGGVYLFSMKFGTNDRVNMLSDINATTSSTSFESTYRLRAQQAPSLLFDTYSYIHLLTDPDPSSNGGAAGAGYNSDFEFYFDKIAGDTIRLVGNKLGSKLVLVKAASATDYTNFTTGTLDVLNKLGRLKTYFKRTTIGGVDCEVKINSATRALTFSYLNGANMTSVTSGFYVDGTTIVFLSPLTIGTAKVTDIKAVTFDAATTTFSGTINGSAFQLKEAITPLKYDMTWAATFYNSPPNGAYWTASAGFTIDGVPDAYKVRTIPAFGFLLFYPKYNPAYSRLGFIVDNAYGAYGPAPVASFPANGTIKFTNFGSFGTAPANILPIVTSTTNKLYDAGGFYVIKTGVTSYDLVSFTDARAWISWKE
eukprot:gene13706-16681_t